MPAHRKFREHDEQVPDARNVRASEHSIAEYRRGETEVAEREREALRLYEPLPFQETFHRCRAKEVIMRKGNQVGGPQPLDEPVLTPHGWRNIGTLLVGDVVIGGDGNPCKVTAVFPQGPKDIYTVTFDDGSSTRCSIDHSWQCKMVAQGRRKTSAWNVHTLQEIEAWGGRNPPQHRRAIVPSVCVSIPYSIVPLDPYLLGVLIGDGSIGNRQVSFSSGDEEVAKLVSKSIPSGMAIRTVAEHGNAKTYRIIPKGGKRGPGCNEVTTILRGLGLYGTKSGNKFIPHQYLHNSIGARLQLLRGLMDTDGTINKAGHSTFSTTSPRLAADVMQLVRSLGGKARVRWVEYPADKKSWRPLAVVSIRIPRERLFNLRRKSSRQCVPRDTSSRILRSIEPTGNAECCCIQVDSPDHTYVTKDYIVTHNSLASFVEVARAVTGQDPYGKYPKTDGTAVCIGWGEKHIATVMYRYFCQKGAFRIIRDEHTRRWRSYRNWPKAEINNDLPGDLERELEARDAPPLIPKRFIKHTAWESHGKKIFSHIELTTGWIIRAYNSAGDAEQAQGFQADLVLIDEDLATGGWYQEMVGRTSMKQGLIRWNAVPHEETEDMWKMMERAEVEQYKPDPHTVMIEVSIHDNPHMPAETKEQNIRLWQSEGEDVYRRRALGQLTVGSVLMYPSYSKHIHGCIKYDPPMTEAQRIVTERMGDPPDDWCRYLIFDPGHTVGAVLFFAVPPPAVGDQVVMYDELYITQCDAHKFGDAVESKARDKVIQEFIIDAHGGRLRELASGIQPIYTYQKELKHRGILSVANKEYFTFGSDDVKGREQLVREALRIRNDGTTRLLVVVEKCPNFHREITRFKKKTVEKNGQKLVVDEGDRRANTHAVECLEYAIAHSMPYVKPKSPSKELTSAERVWQGIHERALQRQFKNGPARRTVNLGPVGSNY